MSAVDRLLVKLARVPVRAHGRVVGGKLQKVDAYFRHQDLEFSISEDGGVSDHWRKWKEVIVTAYDHSSGGKGALALQEGLQPDYYEVTAVNVSDEARGRGMATQMAVEFHRAYPDVDVVHGNFASKQGLDWAEWMVQNYPEWNRIQGLRIYIEDGVYRGPDAAAFLARNPDFPGD